MFFNVAPAEGRLSDLNADLIELYEVMRDSPAELLDSMKRHQEVHCDEHYYELRSNIPADHLSRAARFLYLNRTCWNGLYRVNLAGEFNVPRGSKETVVFPGEDFNVFSNRLRGMELACCDFAETIATAEEGDFLFVDPPYTVKHNLNGFVKYNERLFSWDDQVRLRDTVVEAAERGVYVAMTNADHESVRALYKDKFEYRPLSRASVLAANSQRRGRTTEALFLANLL